MAISTVSDPLQNGLTKTGNSIYLFGTRLPDGIVNAEIAYDMMYGGRFARWKTSDGQIHSIPVDDSAPLKDVVNVMLVAMRMSAA